MNWDDMQRAIEQVREGRVLRIDTPEFRVYRAPGEITRIDIPDPDALERRAAAKAKAKEPA